MTQPIILSPDTVRTLLEAHASLAAWYHSLLPALQAAGGHVEPPSDRMRLGAIQQLARDLPELAPVIQSMASPREYIPPPIPLTPLPASPEEPSAALGADQGARAGEPPLVQAPAQQTAAEAETGTAATQSSDTSAGQPPPSAPPGAPVDPPPLVDPKKVRYE